MPKKLSLINKVTPKRFVLVSVAVLAVAVGAAALSSFAGGDVCRYGTSDCKTFAQRTFTGIRHPRKFCFSYKSGTRGTFRFRIWNGKGYEETSLAEATRAINGSSGKLSLTSSNYWTGSSVYATVVGKSTSKYYPDTSYTSSGIRYTDPGKPCP